MRWPWRRRELPAIPPSPYRPDIRPLEPKDPAYIVEEREMTETGMFRLFPWRKKTVSGSCSDEAKSALPTPVEPSEQPPKTSI